MRAKQNQRACATAPESRIRNKSLVLVLAVLGIAPSVGAQSLVVASGGQTRSEGVTLSINTIPNMPNLVLSVNGGTSCDSFSYQISIEYSDQAGATTGTNVTFNAQDVGGDQSSTVDWFSNFEGGNGTITWAFDGVQQPSFGFFINGSNADNGSVDAYLSSGPWFAENLVAWESGAYKYAPYNQYHQFVATPYDPVWGTPDGIGLMQLEPTNRASGDADYWSWPDNIADGLSLLSSIKSGNGPYNYWTTEYNDMISNTGGNPVPANWPSDCATHANGAVCGGYSAVTFYCSFSSANSNGSPNGFGDGNWIHAYNGYYFVDWVDGTGGATGHWEYDVQGPNNGYVYNVCTSRPL